MVACRDAYARLLEFPSYSHYHVSSLFAKVGLIGTFQLLARCVCVALLTSLMLSSCLPPPFVQTPEFVSSFLHQLLTALHPYARQELDLIRTRKQRDVDQQRHSRATNARNQQPSASLSSSLSSSPFPSTSSSSPPPVEVYPWDGGYYMGQLKASLFDLDADTLTAYFSLSNCIRGVDVVFQHLFGCEVRVSTKQQGEDWTEVRRQNSCSNHTVLTASCNEFF